MFDFCYRVWPWFAVSGHMMYTHKPSMEKFKKDVDAFIDQTSK